MSVYNFVLNKLEKSKPNWISGELAFFDIDGVPITLFADGMIRVPANEGKFYRLLFFRGRGRRLYQSLYSHGDVNKQALDKIGYRRR